MAMRRIKLNGGHTQISVEGRIVAADEDGGFTVPDALAIDLVRQHGGEVVAGLEQLQDQANAVDDAVQQTERQLEQLLTAQQKAHAALDAYLVKTNTAHAAAKAARETSTASSNGTLKVPRK